MGRGPVFRAATNKIIEFVFWRMDLPEHLSTRGSNELVVGGHRLMCVFKGSQRAKPPRF